MTISKSLEVIQSNYVDPKPEKERGYPPILYLIRFGFSTLGRLFPQYAGRLAYKFFTTPVRRAKHSVSDEILESARIFEVLYGKQILKGYEWGSGEKTILLVHGWESRGTGLRSFVPQLIESGYRVVAFDGPAHGNSSGKRTNLPHFAGAIRAIINQIGEVHGIVTHSFGGASTTYAMRYLDNSLRTKKLVFIAVPGRMELVINKAIKMMGVPPQAAKVFKGILESKVQDQPLTAIDVAAAYPHVNVEDVLVIHDRKDPIVSYQAAENIFENWGNANMLVTEGFGHFRIMKHPQVIKRVVNFIDLDY